MIQVEGFTKAKESLARKDFLKSFAASPEVAERIKQVFGKELSLQQVVELIINDVQCKGNKALVNYTEKLDGVKLDSIDVSRQEITAAYDKTDKKLISALELAARRIRSFHLACGPRAGIIAVDKYLRQQIRPLNKIGLYVPGGTAAYPSSVLMMAIPAKVAGVKKIIMASPPSKDGTIPALTLAAASIAGVSCIFKLGGAQAIAAMAFGTESVPKVDKICGPGNIFVTLAKKMVYGTVGIDGLEGPSEIVIVADEKANPILCAADLLAQAEHDPMAGVILITTSSELANSVDREIETQLGKLKRYFIAKQAIDKGVIITVGSIAEAVELVNLYAPEHLSLMVADAVSLVSQIYNAGCIFVGESSPVVLGDYVVGPNHVLPTQSSARFSSPLGVADFLKVTNVVALDEQVMQELSQPAITIARAEGLDAHAQAIEKRIRAK